MKNKILVVAAHPDDEILGIGGTVLKHVERGDEAYCVILATGSDSRYEKDQGSQEEIAKLRNNAQKAAKIIGYKEIFFFDFPDNRMDSADLLDIVKTIETIKNKIKPNIIYTHHEFDLNIDHRICFQAVLTAFRPIGYGAYKIYTFETLSSTEWQSKTLSKAFNPNTYIDISQYIDKKKEAFNQYETEKMDYPHPRSLKGIEILSQYRGIEVGLTFAEGLTLIRDIDL